MVTFKPHPYQKVAIDKIIDNDKFLLFLDMGLGKTVSTLTAVVDLMHEYFEVQKVLVIAPKRVAEDTWSREVFKWEHTRHLRVSKLLGNEKQRRQGLLQQAEIYVINRENVEWLVGQYKKASDWPFDMIVVDELSSFKNPSSKRFKALRKVMPITKRFVGLTGTPSPNGLKDIWSQVYLADRGERLGKTYSIFKREYFDENPYAYTLDLKTGSEDAIYDAIDDICISMKAKDHLQLPERVNSVVEVDLTAQEWELYRELEREQILHYAEGDIVASTAAVLSNKLLQLTAGAVYNENQGVQHIHDAKLNALDDIIEAANGQPILVFYNFKHDVERIKARHKQAVEMGGSDVIEKWNKGEIEILLAHPASAGHGLNLQDGGHIIVWFGLNWSLELYQQANARLDRQGQQNSVIVHHLVLKDSIDEQVLLALEGKTKSQDALMDAVKARMDEVMSNA